MVNVYSLQCIITRFGAGVKPVVYGLLAKLCDIKPLGSSGYGAGNVFAQTVKENRMSGNWPVASSRINESFGDFDRQQLLGKTSSSVAGG